MDHTDRARRYLAKLPPSIQGAGGERALHKACFAIVVGFDIPPDAAFPLLAEYNASAVPPWPDNALRLKLSGVNRFHGERGFLLGGEIRKKDAQPVNRTAPAKPAPSKEALWPTLRLPTVEEMILLEKVRGGVRREAFQLAANHGILRVGLNRTRRNTLAWWLCGDGFVQAKTFDGSLWSGVAKVDTHGSATGKWITCGATQHAKKIILVEGPVGIIEVIEALLRADEEAGHWHEGVGAMASYNAKTDLSPELCRYLAPRSVLIIADAGPTGLEAAKKWRSAIKAAGGSATILQPDSGDLGDLLKSSHSCPQGILDFIHPALPEPHVQ